MFGKKKTLGFVPSASKQRTLEEINKDYSNHSAQAGHKTRVVSLLEEEIAGHYKAMDLIDQEAKRFPKEAPLPPAPDSANEPATQGPVA